jgi:hypothetical protein
MGYFVSKNTLISEKLFCDVFRLIYFLDDEIISEQTRKLCISIEAEISEKIRRREIRKLFTSYKSAPPGSKRESLRREYIKLVQIHKDFSCSHECPYSSL